jgi:hypothetical protein
MHCIDSWQLYAMNLHVQSVINVHVVTASFAFLPLQIASITDNIPNLF